MKRRKFKIIFIKYKYPIFKDNIQYADYKMNSQCQKIEGFVKMSLRDLTIQVLSKFCYTNFPRAVGLTILRESPRASQFWEKASGPHNFERKSLATSFDSFLTALFISGN